MKQAWDLITGEITTPVKSYEDFVSISRKTKRPLSERELLSHILHNSDIDILLKTLGTAFSARTLTIGTTPTEIIPPSKSPRGYILLNPTPSSGITTTVELFSSATRTTAGSPYTSSSQGVASYLYGHLFLDISATTGTPTVSIDIQAYDPVSTKWATTQSDIFSSPSAVGTYYAYIGALGLVTDIRATATLTGGTDSTFSLSFVMKNGLGGSLSGVANTVYIGGRDVNTTNGYPILEGGKETFFLKENVSLWAVSAGSVTIKIFELQ